MQMKDLKKRKKMKIKIMTTLTVTGKLSCKR